MKKFNCLYIFLLLEILVTSGYSKSIYIKSSNTNGDGSINNPYSKISMAIQELQAGDSCIIMEGEYHEEIDLSNINRNGIAPITFCANSNNKPILDGREKLQCNWQHYKNNIYMTKINNKFWQLFKGNEQMTLARFPNAKAWSTKSWDIKTGWRFETDGSKNGLLIDNNNNAGSLGNQNVSFQGAIAVMNLRNWTSYARKISSHTAGTNFFTYDTAKFYTTTHGPYFIEGFAALDTINEWFYDSLYSTLYYIPESLDELNKSEFYGKTQSYFFKGNDNTGNIIFDNLTFFANTIYFSESKNITVKNCDFIYPSYSKRTFGSIENSSATNFSNSTNTIISNCNFKYCDGQALNISGSINPAISDCYFYMIDYACLGTGYTINAKATTALHYYHNTMEIAGASEGLRIAVDPNNENSACLIEYNLFTKTGLTQSDGAAIQNTPMNLQHSIYRYNWFLDNNRTGLRFDGNPGGTYGIVYRNVALHPLRGFRIKGDYHQFYNNTALNAFSKNDIVISIEKGGCEHCITKNNAGQKFSGDDRKTTTQAPIPGTQTNNWSGYEHTTKLSDLLVDPENYDFRPKKDCELIDSGTTITQINNVTDNYIGNNPDIGAYEYGQSYWIPGIRRNKPILCVPKNNAENVSINPDLLWNDALGGKKYIIYLSKNYLDIKYQKSGNIISNNENPSIKISDLDSNTTYYWMVNTINSNGDTIVGNIWSFSTGVKQDRAPIIEFLTPNIIQAKDTNYIYFKIYDLDGDAFNVKIDSMPAGCNMLNDSTLIWTGKKENKIYKFQITATNNLSTTSKYAISFNVTKIKKNYIQTSNNFFIKTCPNPLKTRNKIKFSVPKPGLYKFSIYSNYGNLIWSENYFCKGITETLNENILEIIPNGSYFITLEKGKYIIKFNFYK